MRNLRLIPSQLILLSGAFSNMGQAIILFSLAAFFLPETIGLSVDFFRPAAVLFFVFGLIKLTTAAILVKKGKQ